MEFRKMVTMTLYVRQQKRQKNRLLDSVGEGKGGVIWENSIEACVLFSPHAGCVTLGKLLNLSVPVKEKH